MTEHNVLASEKVRYLTFVVKIQPQSLDLSMGKQVNYKNEKVTFKRENAK